ncbi:hypothetical protein BAUCODRAFT_119233 [Baudoinia panamericana UAMH 10762]|uniref:DUF3835 domain-containing protein n=1 Tax=Baudoinia panamericana (strain UAMH 10762) TaxID=717646 RepID=M2N6G0_BAUPA|nr:uncharacterized protein BAUCODRAFT_119233 [Baudoinia panamericana UAMH 10762]EMC99658.1 hypothetical protein BAUCODRAFT_119233 [Baudoinia panamericana UAMH 10762]
MDASDLSRVDQQRQALEENLKKLRQSLTYWQTFEAEYEGLKEELQDALPNVGPDALLDLTKTYQGELVNESLVRELAGLDKGSPRTALQIIRDIERRQEYVRRNVETIQRRFFEGEAKLEEFDFAATRDSATGLPLTEIEELLDDDDNVVSSRVRQPEAEQSKLVDSLRNAGLTTSDLEGGVEGGEEVAKVPLKPAITYSSPPITASHSLASTNNDQRPWPTSTLPTGDSTHDESSPERPSIRKKSVSFTADTKAVPDIIRFEHEDGKKSVSFAEKVAIAPAAPLPDTRTVQFSPKVEEIPAQPLGPASPQAQATQPGAANTEMQRDLRASFKPGDRVKTIGDDDEVITEDVVLPGSESVEHATTRREMLDYHLHEVGHVVAQMDLDDGDGYDNDDEAHDEFDDASSHWTASSVFGDEDTPSTSGFSDDEDEDEYGRTKGKVIGDDYRKQMLEMQDRLIGNLGPVPDDAELADVDAAIDPSDVRRLVIRNKRTSTSSASSDSSEKKLGGKKRVSFAEDLDVAVPGSPLLKAQKHTEGQNAPPVSDTIAERSTAESHSLPAQGTPAKATRSKKTRAVPADDADADSTASYQAGQTLADTLVERPTPAKPNLASSMHSLDPVAERRQLAEEYYRRRNDIVRQQGGFEADLDEDEELGELMEVRDGKVKKVSRFKAARIKPQ